jgi:site-specific recombinase XerD
MSRGNYQRYLQGFRGSKAGLVRFRGKKEAAMSEIGPIQPEPEFAAFIGIDWADQKHMLRRSFSTHGKKEAHPTEMQAQPGHSDIPTTLGIYTQITDPEGQGW